MRRILTFLISSVLLAGTWTSKPPAGTALDATNSVETGLLRGWFFLEGSGGTTTESVTAGTWTGGSTAAWSTNAGNAVVIFDGTANAVWALTTSITYTDPTILSICALVKTPATNTIRSFILGANDQAYVLGFEMNGYTAGGFGAFRPGEYMAYSAAGSVSAGAWHTLCYTGAGNTRVLYIDGSSTALGISSSYSFVNAVSTPIYIGQRASTGTFPMPSGTAIEFVALWNRTLTPTEISSFTTTPYQVFTGPSATGVRRRVIQ